MRSLFHNTISWSLLAILSLVALCGHGLHFLPFGTHVCGHSPSSVVSTHQHACHPEPHTHHHEQHTHAHHHVTAATNSNPTFGQPAPFHDDDCPLCHYLAQGQTKAVTVLIESPFIPAATTVSLADPLYLDEFAFPHSARGPPAVL